MLNAVLICLSLIAMYISYIYMRKHFNYWKEINVPFIAPEQLVGKFINICVGKESLGEILRSVYKNTTEPYVGLFALNDPCLLVNNLDLIKRILIEDFDHFADRSIADNEKHDPIGSGMLFLLKTPRWYLVRKKLTPTFSSGKMKFLSDTTIQCGAKMVEYVERKLAVNDVIDVRDMCSKFTVNSIAASTLGIETDCFVNEDCPFRVISKKIFNWKRIWYTIQVTCYIIFPKLVQLFNMKFLDPDTTNSLRHIFWEVLAERKTRKMVRNDLIDVLLTIIEQDHIYEKKSLEGDILVAQFAQYFIAGYETTSSTISFALAELALNPDIQTKLRKEIIEAKNLNGSFSYENLNKMEYLHKIIMETLRKYPILPFLDRRCTKTYTIPDTNVTIPKGQVIYISIMGIQHDEKYYPNPQKFDPDRFTKDNRDTRHKLTFLAFGAGPRFCFGQRLGILNVKIGLAYLLSNFEIKVCCETETEIKLIPRGNVLRPENGINLKFVKLRQI